MNNKLQAFERLLNMVDELREKCPWDAKQTIETLRPLTIEETYELADAITNNDLPNVKKELGDILFHIAFYAKIASEKNSFDIADVINTLCDKMVARHPHVYGDLKVADENEVKQNWEKLKLKEGNKSVLSGVPNALPAMVKAVRIQEKAKGVGFDWEETAQVFEKVQEEIRELNEEVAAKKSKANIEDEFGDVLFSLINYARFIDVDPEHALEKTNKKFIKRFQLMEHELKQQGKNMSDLNLSELDEYWKRAKEI